MIIQDREITLVGTGSKLAMMIRGNEQNIDLINPLLDGKDGIGRIRPDAR